MQTEAEFEEKLDDLSRQFQKHVKLETERLLYHEETIKQLLATSLRVDRQLVKLIHFGTLVGISALMLATMFGIFFGLIINVDETSKIVKNFLGIS